MDCTIATNSINPSATLMWNCMLERFSEKNEKWTTSLFSPLPLVQSLAEYAYVGNFSYALRASRKRFLLEDTAIQTGAGAVTPSDIARAYLSVKYATRRKKITSSQYDNCVKEKHAPPMFVYPAEYEQGYYIDLTAAYWQIVRAVGWDVDYNPGRYLGVQSHNEDFPVPFHKMARNMLVTTGMPSNATVWTGTQFATEKMANEHINLVLWRLVCDVLNCVAIDVQVAGATYIFSDGYIVSDARYQYVCDALNSWGMEYTVKRSGKTSVRALGAYSFDGKASKPYAMARPSAHDTLYTLNTEWLRKRYTAMAKTNKRHLPPDGREA